MTYDLFLQTKVPLLNTAEMVGLTSNEVETYLTQGRVNIAVFDSRYGPNSFSPNFYSGTSPNQFEYYSIILQRNPDGSATLCCSDRSVIAEFLRQRKQRQPRIDSRTVYDEYGREVSTTFSERLASANRYYDQHYVANLGRQSDYENQAQNQSQAQREAMLQNEEVKALTAAQQLSLF